jgi:hypothetical protein
MKFCEPSEIQLIRRDHANTKSPRAHRNQRIVCQASLSNLLVIIFGCQARQNPPRLSPVAEIRHQYSLRSIEVAFQSLHHMLAAITGTSVEFLEHNRTQPHHRTRVKPSYSQNSFVAAPQSSNVDGSIEKGGLHLLSQLSVNIFYFDTASDEPLIRPGHQPILLVFVNRKIQGAFDCLRLSLSLEDLLRAPNLCRIQLKMFVNSSACRRHLVRLLPHRLSLNVHNINCDVHERRLGPKRSWPPFDHPRYLHIRANRQPLL